MNKTTLFLKLVIVLILPLTFFSISGCATVPAEQGTDQEPWVGKLTGEIDADLKMFFLRLEEEQDIYVVQGTFKGNIERAAGGHGSGTMRGVIKGKVKDGIFNVHMRGNATVNEGSAAFDGKMIGTLSKTQAFGTWNIDARSSEDAYMFSGEWSAEKIDSVSQKN